MADTSINNLLQDILSSVKALQQENTQLSAAVDAINGRVNILAGVKQVKDGTVVDQSTPVSVEGHPVPVVHEDRPVEQPAARSESHDRKAQQTSKIILTSYPGQAGIDPLPLNWGSKDAALRGPVVVSRNPSSFRKRNGESCCCTIIS